MKTDFSIIGRTRNHENIFALVEGIRKKGYTAYNFLDKPVIEDSSELSWEKQMDQFESSSDFWNDPTFQKHFQEDLQGLKNAETIILLLPAGIAAHVEAGIAFGLGKKLVLIGQPENQKHFILSLIRDLRPSKTF